MSVNSVLRAVSTSSRAVLASSLAVTAIAGVSVVASSAEAASTTVSASTTSAEVLPGTRDPLAWPFARNSIWNTPIGSGAAYAPAGIGLANAWRGEITVDPEHIGMDAGAPVRTLSTGGQAGHGARVRVPGDLSHDGSWNGCATLLSEDGRSAWSGQPLKLAKGGSPSWQYTNLRTATDLRGPGLEGCHGGSGLSGLGGSLRVGELASAAPLRHALKVNLYCAKYCWRGTSMADSKRWPALAADAYWASGYKGKVPAVRMGALLALPPSTDLSAVTDPKAYKIAVALRDYGAYLVDDTAWDVHAISVDKRMASSGEWPTGTSTPFHVQLHQLFTKLAVVDNNAPTSVGGGGVPRAPLAPCFADDAACLDAATPVAPKPAPTTSPAPVPTPTTAPAPVTTTAPAPVVTTPAATAPATDTVLSALTPTRVVNGYGPLEVNRSNGDLAAGDGRTLTIGGRTFATGLGVHARSEVTYALDGRYAHLTTTVGVDDEVGDKGTVVFEIWLDGVLKKRTARLTGSGAPLQLSQSVSGAKTLRLVVTDGGDGIAYDHADWADARLWVAK